MTGISLSIVFAWASYATKQIEHGERQRSMGIWGSYPIAFG